ncbi:MAG: chain length determinant protein EpsF [Burkholderiales bacterium]|nr:chain length determinant protein EpsF [Burkholderiales bacterium]
MSLNQLFAVLRARWVAALAVLLATVLGTLVVSLLLEKQYEATASVVLDVKPDPLSALAFGGMSAPNYLATQVDIIQSDRVAQRVVRNAKLTEIPAVREGWQRATGGQGAIETWLVGNFKKALDVRPSRESNVIAVSYRANDPAFAAGMANEFVRAYIETSLELRVEPARQYNAFFETRMKESRAVLEKAQSALSDFQRAKGIVATDERFDIENSRLAELSSQLVALQALSGESNSREAQAKGASGDKLQEVFNNPVVAGLRGDVARVEAKLQELRARLGEKHPQVVEMQASLAELRVRLEAEVKRTTSGVSVTSSINRQREAQVRADLQTQRAKVLQMKEVRDEGMVLVRDVENAQRAYDAVFARLNQTSLESQATQSNVNLLNAAVAPLEHASPRVALNLFLALLIGLMLALGTVMVLEMMDRHVRVSDDLTLALDVPVLGEMCGSQGSKANTRLLGLRKLPQLAKA